MAGMIETHLLNKALGGPYGGPSISREDSGKYILYSWTDAPVGYAIYAEGDTFDELLAEVAKLPTDRRTWKAIR